MRPGLSIILLVTALLVFSISAQAAGAADAKSYIAKGDECAKRNDLAAAFDYFSKALELDPKSAGAHHRIGLLYFTKAGLDLCDSNDISSCMNYCDLAIKHFSTAISLDPTYDKPYRFRAICYEAISRLDWAIADYTKAIKLDPKEAELYADRGDVYTRKKKLDAALQDYQTCARLNPKIKLIYAKLGATYADKGMHQKAIQAYDKALQLRPDYSIAYYLKGASYMEMGKKQEALASFQKFVSKFPSCAPEYAEEYSTYCDKAYLCIDMLKKQLAGSTAK